MINYNIESIILKLLPKIKVGRNQNLKFNLLIFFSSGCFSLSLMGSGNNYLGSESLFPVFR